MGLNPLSTGKSVQTKQQSKALVQLSLNPLSTGKSVQTEETNLDEMIISALIPYLQGSLFRRQNFIKKSSMHCLNPLSTGKSVQTMRLKKANESNGS